MNEGSPIRLFADAHVFDDGYEGTRSFLLGMYTELAQLEGVQVFLGARNCTRLRDAFAPVADRIQFIPYATSSRYGRLFWELPHLLQKHDIDYAHFQYVAPPRKVCAYIVTTHDVLFEDMPGLFPYFYRKLRHNWFRHSALRADVLTTVSEYAATSIAAHFGIAKHRIAIVPNAVAVQPTDGKLQQAARHRLRERYGVDRYVLCVSRMEPRKNQEQLLEAFRELELAAKGYQLVLIGRRSMGVPLLDAALTRLQPHERAAVWLLNDVPDVELLDWYRGCRLFVYPSLGEGFGIPPLEAAMARVPVLCSNLTAMADFHFFGNDLVDVTHRSAFITKLCELLTNPPGHDVLEERARIIAERYSWQWSAKALLSRIHDHQLQAISR
ncbi:MAG: glycosyltransferase family 1 protein [Chitinophagaceae bacterium]|nr:MAG: glycosyltransferase family 1 protein [Chitinophagaceae bacterium]